MSKKYVGKNMMMHSRFIKYLETMNNQEYNEVAAELDKYVFDNKVYCDKGNYTHLCNIFTSMALFNVLTNHGKNSEEAENIIFETMYHFMQKQKEQFQKLSKKGWFWPVIKKIVPIGFKKGSGYGWKYTWFKNQPKNEFRFECNSCIYRQIFSKYGFERFGPKFCYNDIIVYGELARTDFIRTMTINRGDEKCDFKFIRYKKNEKFDRTKSV